MKKIDLKILTKGYAKKMKNYLRASSTAVLIEDEKSMMNILVDPGANKTMLLKALKKEGLKPDDINLIFITHYHIDHVLNIRLFPEKEVLDGEVIYRDDKEIKFSEKIPNTDIKVIKTPGHSQEHVCLIVETEDRKILIAGDLFWWFNNQEQKTSYQDLIDLEDSYASDQTELKKSRENILKILKSGDLIIPGHGNVFKV